MSADTQLSAAIGDNQIVKEQLQRAKQSLEAEPAPAAASEAPADASAGVDKKAQQRAKKADDYHARHKGWVAEFNELTGGECAGGEGGVKWAAVRAWQQKHWQLNNLLADGLVGPKTIEAAKLLQKKNAPKKEGADEKEGGGEKEAARHAEGAEASADKPNLEADDVDEQIAPAASTADSAPAAKQATIEDFRRAAKTLKEAMAQFHAPKAEPGEKPIAQHYVEETEDSEAPPALGAMMKTDALQGFEAAADQLKGTGWSDRTPPARAKLLLDAVNGALAAEKVPAIQRVDLQDMPNPGEFIAKQWIMHMSEKIFTASAAPNIPDVASKVFHEGRHAEQRFTIARLVATKNPTWDAGRVARAAKIWPEAAVKACALRSEPLSSEQTEKAEAFKHATVDNPAHQQIEESSAAITDAANKAGALFHALSPADQAKAAADWQQLRQQAIVKLEAYYHLATERDAFAAQKQLAEATK